MRISFNPVGNSRIVKNNPLSKLLFGVIFVAIVAVLVLLMIFGPEQEQIEDSNGADNFALQTISDSNIINNDMGSTGVESSKNSLTKNYTYSSDKFSGVEMLETDIHKGIGDTIEVEKLDVKSGNFTLAVVENDKIVHKFEPNKPNQTYTVDGAEGTYYLMIAGESADFELKYNIH